jgi:hypothetical protein
MKYLITERQYSLLLEQQPKATLTPSSQPSVIQPTTNVKSGTVNPTQGTSGDIDKHTAMTILQIATAFIPLVGPFISAGIGLADAAMYYNEGDKKTAGMVGLFSIIPGIGGLTGKLGLGKVTSKMMASIGKKVSAGLKLTAGETQIVNKIAQNRNLIQAEIKKLGADAGISAAKQNVKKRLVRKNIAAKTGKFVGTKVAPYVGTGIAYSKGYDYVQKYTPKTKSQLGGYKWDFVRTSFGSSGTKEENDLLNQAWDKGWRPGQVVPTEFQTKQYQNVYAQETQNINSLNQLIAQAQGQK